MHCESTKIFVAGIGPGSPEDITPAVLEAVRQSDVVVGYKYYFQFITSYLRPETECIDTGMKKERERASMAFQLARQGKTVCVISSGDAGIYGMTPLMYEMQKQLIMQEQTADSFRSETICNGQVEQEAKCIPASQIEIIPLPGISAFQKASSLLGAPMGHDFCIISMSDLMTPWALIEKRIKAAASADFVTAIYNPKSNGRYWQLHRLKELFLKERNEDNVVGYVRQAGRDEQEVKITTLKDFDPEDVDMFTIVIIGNSQSYNWQGKFVTPRGYMNSQVPSSLSRKEKVSKEESGCASVPNMQDGGKNLGQNIMIKSFQTIRGELRHPDIPVWRLWPMLHAIHTTADFDMEQLLWMDDEATAIIYEKVKNGTLRTIVTDVSMVASGIRKGALERLNIEVKTYINDPRSAEMAQQLGITRAQAGMRLASEEHPDALFAFGNAPTALLELCELMRKGKCQPAGIIGAPVGFVHVEESKHAVKVFKNVPKLIIEGRKGGSNLAATLVNSILTFDDAEQLKPGRDV